MSGPARSELDCHGQLPGAPIFGPGNDRGEIMYTIPDGDGVWIYVEDNEEPGQLNPIYLSAEEFADLLASQPQLPEEEYPEGE